MPNIFRSIPSVNQLLESPQLKKMVENVNHQVVVDGVRTFIDDLKEKVTSAAEEIEIPSPSEMAEKIADWLQVEHREYLRPVINGTGIILHTGLGRAPLAKSALEATVAIAGGYASVEVDLRDGQRGQRVKAVEKLLCDLTGAEAAVVVNNNAAATMIALATVATGKEVIVSRGQLIEIGGSYRLPDVMQCSGCRLKEVGTTNKTHADDYSSAIGEDTGAILKVHPSNFEVVGFTKTVSTKELVTIAHANDLPMIDDVGSGALIDFAKFGLSDEPIVKNSIDDGADIVLFSGDKLIGGPQCGIIIGKRKYIDRVLKNSLMRAMRVDKMTLAALAATLRLYRNQDTAEQEVPILRMLSMPVENLELRAQKVAQQIQDENWVGSCEVVQSNSMLGGGSLPTQKIPTWCVAIGPRESSVNHIAARLRSGTAAVIGRIQKDTLLIDMRTVFPNQDLALVEILQSLSTGAPCGDGEDTDRPEGTVSETA
jgi:L-seryl-tRNA(Ser) seleniumtransferase